MAVKNDGYFQASSGSNYQPNNINGVALKKTGKTVGQTSMAGSVNALGKSLDGKNVWTDGKNNYVWVADGTNRGYYVKVTDKTGPIDFTQFKKETNKTVYNTNSKNSNNKAVYYDVTNYKTPTTQTQQNTKTTKSNNKTSSGSGYSAPKTDATYNNLSQQIVQQQELINELQNPKVLSADEIASQYGIDYNEQNILNAYNNATNEFYNNQIDYYNTLKNDYLKDNASYIDQQLQDYANSYAYGNQGNINKSARNANALSTYLSNTYTNAMNDLGMQQTIDNLEAARQNELSNNVYNAKDYYTQLGTALAQASASHNTSDVQKYTDTLNSYNTKYSADRAYQSALASANATKYSGLASAAATNAQAQAAKTTDYEQLYNQYLSLYGNTNAASSAYWKNQINSQGKV